MKKKSSSTCLQSKEKKFSTNCWFWPLIHSKLMLLHYFVHFLSIVHSFINSKRLLKIILIVWRVPNWYFTKEKYSWVSTKMKTRLGTSSGLLIILLWCQKRIIVVSKSFEANNGSDPTSPSLAHMQRRGLCRSNLHKLHLIFCFGPDIINWWWKIDSEMQGFEILWWQFILLFGTLSFCRIIFHRLNR